MSSGAAEQTPQSSAAPAQEEVSLLDQIISQGRLARDDEQRALAKDLIGEFVGQIMAGTMTVSKNTLAMINQRIGQIDALITKQLNAVLHHQDFQALEAAWRGLHYFV